MSENQILADILQSVRESNESIQELDKKFELHEQKMQFEIEKINELDDHQNKLIAEHIAGVNTLRDMHRSHRKEAHQMIKKLADTCDARLSKLEEPSPWVIWLKHNKIIAATVLSIVGGATAVIRFWDQLMKVIN